MIDSLKPTRSTPQATEQSTQKRRYETPKPRPTWDGRERRISRERRHSRFGCRGAYEMRGGDRRKQRFVRDPNFKA